MSMTIPYRLTIHARQRMTEMGVRPAAVAEALREPEMDYTAPRRHGADARIACRGPIAVAYKPDVRDPNCKVVLTVLWNRKEFVRP